MMHPLILAAIVCFWTRNLANCQNPCQPNPCGDNTRCLVQAGTSENPVISCQCLSGYTQNPDGAFEGCISSGPIGGGDDDGIDLSKAVQTPTSNLDVETSTKVSTATDSGVTTDRPYALPTSKTVIGFDSDGTEVKLFAAESVTKSSDTVNGGIDDLNPIGLADRNSPTKVHFVEIEPSASLPPHIENLGKEGVFNEECLISEDCVDEEFCDVTIRKCRSSCSHEVCGTGADCKGRLHRPVCFCPKGYDGNPQLRCEKAKSRAGTRFRREGKVDV